MKPPASVAARRLSAGLLAALLGACSLFGPAPPLPGIEPPPDADVGRLVQLDSKKLDLRLLELTLQTSALNAPTKLRILLPDRYDSTPNQRYPVLYLLQGAVDDYTAWIREGNAEAMTAGYPMIIVMPDAGDDGFYCDWFNNSGYGTPQWETYHIRQLIPFIDAHFRTEGTRHGRAIGGVSMGGFGAISYAARHPELFAAAISFSGLVDNTTLSSKSYINNAVFGPYKAEEVRWRGHNPVDLADNLRGMDVTLYMRDGLPGKNYFGVDPAEIAAHLQNENLHKKLDGYNIPHHWKDLGSGAHQWSTWHDDLSTALLALLDVFKAPPPPPSTVDFTAIEPDYAAWGWRVTLDRPALEFSSLVRADAHGFVLSGSGVAVVTTPAFYPAGTELPVTLSGVNGEQTQQGHVASDGRLRIRVPLGPGNAAQQFTDAAKDAGGTKVYATRVSIGKRE